jgi:hypothetical protein
MFQLISFRLALLFGLVAVLVGCGNVNAPAAQTGPTAGAPPTAPPPATAAQAPATAVAPAATRPASATAAQPPAPTAGQSGLSEGLTPEGYHYLGRADAPVTLVMYSDFL